MQQIPTDDSSLRVIRRRDRPDDPFDYRRVRRALRDEAVARIAPGVFVAPQVWNAVSPMLQHRQRVREAADRMRHSAVISHHAAAAIWGIDILGPWPSRIDVRVPARGGGRSTGLIRRHALGVEDIELITWRDHHVTSPGQTVLDLAAAGDFLHGVVAMDQALWQRRPGGALVQLDALHSLSERRRSVKGSARIRRALDFATGQSDSVRETQSRVLIQRLGFPTPVLQHPISLADGTFAYLDFFFPDHDHGAEFDGVGKYLDPALRSGRTAEEMLLAEKDRGDAVRRAVSRLSRWRTPDLRRPRQLYDILVADGLPSAVPPPPASLLLHD